MINKYYSYILIAILIGFLATQQFKLKFKVNEATSNKSISQISNEVEQNIKMNAKLRDEHASLEQQRTSLEKAQLSTFEKEQSQKDESTKLNIILGKTKVSGPGIAIKFTSQIQLAQLVDLVNTIRNIGVDAIVINEQRIVIKTPLTQEMVSSDGLEIKIIGDKEVLQDSLERTGGILGQIGRNSEISKHDEIVMEPVKK